MPEGTIEAKAMEFYGGVTEVRNLQTTLQQENPELGEVVGGVTSRDAKFDSFPDALVYTQSTITFSLESSQVQSSVTIPIKEIKTDNTTGGLVLIFTDQVQEEQVQEAGKPDSPQEETSDSRGAEAQTQETSDSRGTETQTQETSDSGETETATQEPPSPERGSLDIENDFDDNLADPSSESAQDPKNSQETVISEGRSTPDDDDPISTIERG